MPDYMLRRFPPHRQQELQTISSDSESFDSDQPLDIPEKASVKFAVCDGKPGLQVRTRNTSNWTHIYIASRTRAIAKLNRVVTHSRVHAYISHRLFMSSVVQYIVQELL